MAKRKPRRTDYSIVKRKRRKDKQQATQHISVFLTNEKTYLLKLETANTSTSKIKSIFNSTEN